MSALFVLPWRAPLIEGRLVRRYHRFLADICLADGAVVVAHCINSGSMEGLVRPGARVWVARTDSAKGRLAYRMELIEAGGVLVGANTVVPNALAQRLLERGLVAGLRRPVEVLAEQRFGEHSRVDFIVRTATLSHYVEVKNCHLVYADRRGYFPDSVSERATSHLRELVNVVRCGARATVLFVVQHGAARALRPSDVHDPTFAKTARWAAKRGVHFRAMRVAPTLSGLVVERAIPVDLERYDTGPIEAWRREAAPFSGWERPPRKG